MDISHRATSSNDYTRVLEISMVVSGLLSVERLVFIFIFISLVCLLGCCNGWREKTGKISLVGGLEDRFWVLRRRFS